MTLEQAADIVGVKPPGPALGITAGEPIGQYHASGCVGHSSLEIFRAADRGPRRFHGQYIARNIPKFEGSDATDIGQAFDCLTLEKREVFEQLPVNYLNEKGEQKKFTMASNVCKGVHADIERRGLIPLHFDDVQLIRKMTAATFANPTIAALLSVGAPQITMRHKFGAFTVQIRPDWWNPAGVVLPDGTQLGAYMADLKSAEDMDQFLKNRRAFGYDRQAALYREIARLVLAILAGVPVEEIEPPDFYFLVTFKTAPIEAVVFKLRDYDIDEATNEITDDLRRLRRCYETNDWPGCAAGIQEMPKLWRKSV